MKKYELRARESIKPGCIGEQLECRRKMSNE